MFTKRQILSYLKYSIAAAIGYLIFLVIFLSDDTYTKTYFLYIGNVVFAAVIVVFLVNFNKKGDNNENTVRVISAGLTTALIGTIICVLAVFIIMAIMKPTDYSYVANTASELAKPTPSLEGNGHAMMLILFMDAIIGNMGTSSFVAFMLPNMIRKYKDDSSVVSPK